MKALFLVSAARRPRHAQLRSGVRPSTDQDPQTFATLTGDDATVRVVVAQH